MRLSLLSLVAVATASNPVGKVIELLTDLKAQTLEEGKSEATVYDKYSCFCKDKTDTKSDEILASQTLIDEESARLAEQTGLRDRLIHEIAELNKQIDKFHAEMKQAEADHLQDKTHREAVIADLRKAVSSLEGALKSIQNSKSGSLVAVRQVVRKNLLVAEALGMTSPKVTAFLQSGGDKYEFHSGGILDTLGELKTEFSGKLADDEEQLAKVKKAHEDYMSAKQDAVTAANDSVDTKTTEKDDAIKQVGEAQQALVQERGTLADAQLYLKDLTKQCELKAREWDQRSSMRNGEVEALSAALELLEGKVKEKDTAANKRALLSKKMLLKRPAVVSDMSDDDVDLSFVQVAASEKTVAKVNHLARQHQSRILQKLVTKANSMKADALAEFGQRMMANPFGKVKKLIAQLIERLLQESADEASHKGWCDSSLMKARKERGYRQADAEKLNNELESNEATRDQNELDVENLTKELEELNKALDEATSNRAEEKENNQTTLKDAKEGLTAVNQAITILKEFYYGKHGVGGANSATVSMIQASPVTADAPEVHSGAYQGNQDQAGGIVGMLQVIASDFERTVKVTSKAEHDAHRAHVDFSTSTKASIAGAETESANKSHVVQTMKHAIKKGMKDLTDTLSLMDNAVKEIEDLKPACIDTGMSYEERVQKREEEIEALKSALCQLDPEQVEVDCS